MECLDDYVFCKIIKHLDIFEIAKVSLVSKKINRICQNFLPNELFKMQWYRLYSDEVKNYQSSELFIKESRNSPWKIRILYDIARLGKYELYFWVLGQQELSQNNIMVSLKYATISENLALVEELLSMLSPETDFLEEVFMQTVTHNKPKMMRFYLENFNVPRLSAAKLLADIYSRDHLIKLIEEYEHQSE